MRQLKITKQITNRESEAIDKYLLDISRVALISPEEETALAQRIRSGDEVALEQLVNANLRFVVSVAKQYQNMSLPLDDLISEGNLGLVKAASRFDETRGFKFISYAVWWIRQSITQALAEHSRIVRLPLNRISAIRQISKKSAELAQQYEREPTADELAREMNICESEVVKNIHISSHQVSMDAPLYNEEQSSLKDLLEDHMLSAPDSELLNGSLKLDIQRALATLTYRESQVLLAFFGLLNGHTLSLEEIAGNFEITSERVRQIKHEALKKLKKSSRSKILQSYLE